MNFDDLKKRLGRSGSFAALAYGAAVVLLLTVSWLTLAGLAEAYGDYRAAEKRLAVLEGRGPQGLQQDDEPKGSPFLEGPTFTVAGADLQRRVASAIAAVGGVVLSSQVDLQGSQAAEGFVVLSTNFEVSQSALQPLLYDLEAGVPLLFVEQLIIQSTQGGGANKDAEGKRMRVQIDVSGEWRAPK